MRKITVKDSMLRAQFWRIVRHRLQCRNPRKQLAEALDTSPSYISRLVNGEQRTGRKWKSFRKLLKPPELALIENIEFQGEPWRFDNYKPAKMRAKKVRKE